MLVGAALSLMSLSGCDDWSPADQASAGVSTVSAVRMNVHVNEAPTAKARASVDVSGFLVTVTDRNGETVSYNDKPCSWTYSTMPQVFTLPVGEYTVHVASHTPEAAAFDAPYYVGSEDFTVENNTVTYIGTVTCRFASLKVGIRFSDLMLKLLGDDARVSVAAGQAGTALTWTKDDASRDGYFYVVEDNPTVVATFSANIKGEDVYLTKDITDAVAGNYYIFNFAVTTGQPDDEFGGFNADLENPTQGVYMDYEVIENRVDETITPDLKPTVDPEEHPDHEEWPDPVTPGPVTPGPEEPTPPDVPGNDDNGIVPTYEGINPNGLNSIEGDAFVVNINSEEPLAHVEVEIISDFLTVDFLAGVGMATKFDLCDPEHAPVDPKDESKGTMDLTDALLGFGFPIGNDVIGAKTLRFELTELIPLLASDLGAQLGQIHTFRLTIVDDKGNRKVQDLKFETTK